MVNESSISEEKEGIPHRDSVYYCVLSLNHFCLLRASWRGVEDV